MSRKANFNSQRFYGHDNRHNDDHNIRRVSVQNNQGRITKNKSKWSNVRDRFGWDEDVDMAGNNNHHYQQSYRGSFRGGRGGGGGRRTDRRMGPNVMGAFGGSRNASTWYEIKIVLGARYSRDVILGKLTAYLGNQKFFPICYQIQNTDSVFYVDKFQDAQLLLSCTRKVSLDDGSVMLIKIRQSRPPFPAVDEAFKEKMKAAMAKRYIQANKALDLTRFSRDPEFIDGIYCSLARPTVLAAAIKIINDNIPDLVALKLTGNGIADFEGAAAEIHKMKALRILHINENNDNMELTPIVAFDVGEETKFPAPQAAFICHAEGRGFVKAFLSQYFQIYDSDNRKDLEQAYEPHATFSMTIPNIFPSGPRLNMYVSTSRNLLRPMINFPRRRSLLYQGRASIVDVLSGFPKTEHDLMSFAVDLTFFSPVLINLNVTGLFREKGDGSPRNWPLRHFSRTFLIVPVGNGFCIVNDVLFITNASPDQAEVAFKTVPPKPEVTSSPVASYSSPAATLDPAVQLQMMQAVAEQTGMNIEWSRKCLEETSWDFQRAVFTFAELQKRGVIPPEAFIKT